MKASELIAHLQALVDQHGDLEAVPRGDGSTLTDVIFWNDWVHGPQIQLIAQE